MNLIFENSFTVMPDQCNYMYPMIFGGAFFSQMDLCAAACVNRLLHDSVCDSAVTHKVLELTFHAAAYCGDLIFMKAEVVDVRHKAVKVIVSCLREKRAEAGQDFIAQGTFVFVTKKDGEFHPHGIKIPD